MEYNAAQRTVRLTDAERRQGQLPEFIPLGECATYGEVLMEYGRNERQRQIECSLSEPWTVQSFASPEEARQQLEGIMGFPAQYYLGVELYELALSEQTETDLRTLTEANARRRSEA